MSAKGNLEINIFLRKVKGRRVLPMHFKTSLKLYFCRRFMENVGKIPTFTDDFNKKVGKGLEINLFSRKSKNQRLLPTNYKSKQGKMMNGWSNGGVMIATTVARQRKNSSGGVP